MFTIVTAEDKVMKEYSSTIPQRSDVGQLLFYMLGVMIQNVSDNNQYQLGLFIEGNQILLCYGSATVSVGSREVEMDFKVLQFINLLDVNSLKMICDSILSVRNFILENK
ncbi:PREDICTED: uncharacterized protein LOC109583265 [Amphimedon queenslandica]|uniref:Uncharacterized protein n=1 Tax=Amphimedon queenslandica TaxID=400682 RepID=A0AAN0JAS0_AMPQE|nr:PREDICTED: uncharacterized protein LOC109583265 [Amphimedon queenslandica]|eukprot:XP_019854084.1 PREDICTED: uncharacterized protein LOC109583265 [Amphimedon queenslandica]